LIRCLVVFTVIFTHLSNADRFMTPEMKEMTAQMRGDLNGFVMLKVLAMLQRNAII